MKRKTVLFADSWSVAARFITPIVKKLNKNYHTYFLHFDNMQIKYGSNRIKNDLATSDHRKYYRYYKGVYNIGHFDNSVSKALKTIKPDIIVFISLHGFEHKYVNEIASLNGIPSIMYMHGLRSGNFFGVKQNLFKKIIEKHPRALYYSALFYNYVTDCYKYNKKINYLKLLRRYYLLVFKHRKFILHPGNDDGTSYTTILTICNNDIEYFSKHYGIDTLKTKFKVIGHIDNHNLIKHYSSRKNHHPKNKAIFFSQPLIADSLIKEQDFEKTIQLSISIAQKLNKEFILRPHPNDDFNFLKKIKKKYAIRFSENELHNDLIDASIVIGVNSTSMLAAQVLKKPILLYGFATYPPHEALKNYSESIIINDLSSPPSDIIDNLSRKIDLYTPPSPDELQNKDPLRAICTAIEEIVNEKT